MVLNRVSPSPLPEEPRANMRNDQKLLDEEDPLDFPTGDNGNDSASSSSSLTFPWPENSYIIRCTSTGEVLTLRNGEVVLTTQPGLHNTSSSAASISSVGKGSIQWKCKENGGWLGFRNEVSGHYLGHDDKGRLYCSASRQQAWEHFVVRVKPEGLDGAGGCVLLMTHSDFLGAMKLWHVGFSNKPNEQGRLAKIADGANGGLVWEFIKV